LRVLASGRLATGNQGNIDNYGALQVLRSFSVD
jgi:hypothetical protein